MARLPILKAHEIIRALEKAGFQRVRQRGGHARLKHPDGRVTSVPVHTGEDIDRWLLKKILRDAKISRKALKPQNAQKLQSFHALRGSNRTKNNRKLRGRRMLCSRRPGACAF
jgi:predicted RNA binding protein YcfA (HicA-like mRNA interferase family)